MAKTTGPLMSEKASGTFANQITFTRRGVAHAKNSPGNQYTSARGNARQIFKATSKALQRCAPATIAAIRNVTGCGPNWRAAMTDAVSGDQHATWSNVAGTWAGLTQPARDAWNSAAADASFTDTTLAYATDPLISAGLAMFELASALYTAGIIVSPGEPGAGNAIAWTEAVTGLQLVRIDPGEAHVWRYGRLANWARPATGDTGSASYWRYGHPANWSN